MARFCLINLLHSGFHLLPGILRLTLFVCRLYESFLHGRSAFLYCVSGCPKFEHGFLVDFLDLLQIEVVKNHILGNSKFSEVFQHLLAARLEVKALTQCHLLDALNDALRDRLWYYLQHSVTECDCRGCITSHDLHVFGVCFAVLISNASFDFHAYGYVCLKVMTDSLCGDGTSVIPNDSRLYAKISPRACDDFRHTDGKSLYGCAATASAPSEDIETVRCRLGVHCGIGADFVQYVRDVARVLFGR